MSGAKNLKEHIIKSMIVRQDNKEKLANKYEEYYKNNHCAICGSWFCWGPFADDRHKANYFCMKCNKRVCYVVYINNPDDTCCKRVDMRHETKHVCKNCMQNCEICNNVPAQYYLCVCKKLVCSQCYNFNSGICLQCITVE